MAKLRFLMAIMLFLVYGCSFQPIASAYAQQGGVRLVNASPDAPAVELYIDGKAQNERIDRFKVSSYFSLTAGNHTFELIAVGQEPTALATIQATVQGNVFYTIAATGRLENLSLQFITDDRGQPTEGYGRLRVYHLSPDAPAVDLRRGLAQPSEALSSIQQELGETLISGVAFPNVSNSLMVASGVYTLEIFPATVPAPELIVLPSQTIESRKIYSIFVVDMLINIKAFVAPSEGLTPAELPNTAEMSKSHEPIFFLAFFLLTIGLLIRLINSIYSLEQVKSK